MPKRYLSVGLIRSGITNFDRQTRYQLTSLVVKLNNQFPTLFKSPKWQDYMCDIDEIPNEMKVLICLDQQIYEYMRTKVNELCLIKLKGFNLSVGRKKVRHSNFSKMDRIRINVRVKEAMRDLEEHLLSFIKEY